MAQAAGRPASHPARVPKLADEVAERIVALTLSEPPGEVTHCKRMEQVDASIARYLAVLDRADREEGEIAEAQASRIREKIAGLRRQMQALRGDGA